MLLLEAMITVHPPRGSARSRRFGQLRLVAPVHLGTPLWEIEVTEEHVVYLLSYYFISIPVSLLYTITAHTIAENSIVSPTLLGG